MQIEFTILNMRVPPKEEDVDNFKRMLFKGALRGRAKKWWTRELSPAERNAWAVIKEKFIRFCEQSQLTSYVTTAAKQAATHFKRRENEILMEYIRRADELREDCPVSTLDTFMRNILSNMVNSPEDRVIQNRIYNCWSSVFRTTKAC